MASRSVNDFVAEGGRVLPSDDSMLDCTPIASAIANPHGASDRRARTVSGPVELDDALGRLMSAFSVDYDGRCYRCNGYRYDRLADAVAYAELMQSRQSTEVGPDPFTGSTVAPPSASDEKIMASMSISFRAGAYAYRGFRYDHLADAVNYARIDVARSGRGPDGPVKPNPCRA